MTAPHERHPAFLRTLVRLSLALTAGLLIVAQPALAQPVMTDDRLGVRTVVSDLELPTSLAFIGPNDFFVLEKNSGRVLRIQNGQNMGSVLDLGVNFASERGLLGIALEPGFPERPGVYLYWTCRTDAPPADPFRPDVLECSDTNMFTTDSEVVLEVPHLANRVDRFTWNGTQLTYDRNLIKLLAFQNDAAPDPPGQGDGAQPARGNHDGGILAFGPDGKLYVLIGDVGRRGQLQNLPSGPTPTGLGPTVPDDQFGGPQPDDRHFAGVILRLNEDGTAPSDNPFFEVGADMGGEVGENIQKIFAYGLRNSFGMAFDPKTGNLWQQENGEDAFDELNLVEPGMNGGWIQFMGPADRVAEYREIETTSLHGGEDVPNLQQLRWGSANIATTPAEAMSRLFVLPGSHYSDPEFSWKHVIAPGGIGFSGDGLGPHFDGNLFVGLAVPLPEDGPLFRFRLTGGGRKIAAEDRRLKDRVADNLDFNELTESEELLIGTGFGVVTDIETGPGGNLYVVSLSNGAVYEVFAQKPGRNDAVVQSGNTDPAFVTEPTPNPTTGTVAFQFQVPTAGRATLTVLDARGRIVARPLQGAYEAGIHPAAWNGVTQDGARAARGIYFLRLDLPDGATSSRRIVLTE